MTDSQDKFYDDQNTAAFDPVALYNSIIAEIDNIRSKFNSSSLTVTNTLSINKATLDSVISKTDNNTNTYQESRCNAFYRMIGFPVIGDINSVSDGFYSPGYDPNINLSQSDLDAHYLIATNFLKNYSEIVNKVLSVREQTQSNYQNIFNGEGFDSTVLAISSALFPRSFDSQFKDGLGPLDVDLQKIRADGRVSVYAKYSDKFPDATILPDTSVPHTIKPFIVDPRIELTVSPSKNRIAAPFLLNKSQLKLTQGSNGITLKRPYIEKVMRTRFNTTNRSLTIGNSSGLLTNTISAIKSDTNITNVEQIQVAFNLNTLNSSFYIFGKFIKIIRALILQVVKWVKRLQQINTAINWQPVPNKNLGPELGSSLRDIDNNESAVNRNKLIELDLIKLNQLKVIDQTIFDIGTTSPSLGDFAFSNIDDVVFGSFKNIGTFYQKQIDLLNKKRKTLGDEANNISRNIEIIMGDFSGIGLIDTLAIQAALWVVDLPSLAGMIDDNAFNRMQLDNSLKYTDGRNFIKQSMENYEKILSNIYKLMQAYYNGYISGKPAENPF